MALDKMQDVMISGTQRDAWDVAVTWGDHSVAGYALASAVTNSANWDTAYGWGDHSLAGYALASALSSGLGSKVNSSTYTAGLALKADLVGGVIPSSQIPAIAISEFLGNVADEPAMLALVGDRGDWCIRTDTSTTYILAADDSSVIGSWVALPDIAGAGGSVTSVNSQSGIVILGAADIGLDNVNNTSDANKPVSTAQQTALDLKLDATAIAAEAAQVTNLNGGALEFWSGTQTDYDLLTPDASTLYFITGA